MGRFDEQIAYYRRQSEKTDGPFQFRFWRNGLEVTNERDERERRNKNMFKRLVDAFLRHND